MLSTTQIPIKSITGVLYQISLLSALPVAGSRAGLSVVGCIVAKTLMTAVAALGTAVPVASLAIAVCVDFMLCKSITAFVNGV